MSVKKYERGTTAMFEAEFWDQTQDPEILIDPTTVTITVWQPDETKKVDGLPMIKVGTGYYRYKMQIDASDQLGMWKLEIKGVVDSLDVVNAELFKVVEVI